MHKHFRAYGLEHARRAIEECGGGVFALAHFGSWDVAAGCGLASGLRITTVMAPVGPDLVTRIAAWARRHQDTGPGVIECCPGPDSGGAPGPVAAILSDIPDRGETVLVDFCGGKVAFSTAAVGRLGLLGSRSCRSNAWRIGGSHRLVIHTPVPIEPGDGDVVVMQRVATGLEAAIRRAPEWWYPFGEVYRD